MSHIHYAFGKLSKEDTDLGGNLHYHMAYNEDGDLEPTSIGYDSSGHTHLLNGKECGVPIVLADKIQDEDH